MLKCKMRHCQDHRINTLLHTAQIISHINTYLSKLDFPTTAVQQRQSVNPVGFRSPRRTSWTAFDCSILEDGPISCP